MEGCGGLGDGNEQPTSWPRGSATGWTARLEEGGSAWGGERLALAGGSRLERSSPEEARARVEGSSPEEARATLAGNAGTSGRRSVAEGGGDAPGGAGRRKDEPRRGRGKEGGGAAPPPVAAPLPGHETFCEP